MYFLLFQIFLSQVATDATDDVFAILEEERDIVEVSTRKATSVRVAPAIVDVLTDADILDVRGNVMHKVRLGAAGTLSLFAAASNDTGNELSVTTPSGANITRKAPAERAVAQVS